MRFRLIDETVDPAIAKRATIPVSIMIRSLVSIPFFVVPLSEGVILYMFALRL